LKILYAAAEAAPFLKTGGLADISGSLPITLKEMGNDIRVVMPLYSNIPKEYKDSMEKIIEFNVKLGWRNQLAEVYSLKYRDLLYYFIGNDYYFNRVKPYGEYDDGERFTFFSKSIALLPRILSFKPDILHSNDWHTGLVSLYIKDFARGDPFYKEIKTVYTIHNLKYQGIFPYSLFEEVTGLSSEYFHDDGLKFNDDMNFMKAGIVYSDHFTTVSNSYAEEIKYSFFGEGLEGIVRKKENKLTGIVNGIDYNIYNPNTDKNIFKNYDVNTI